MHGPSQRQAHEGSAQRVCKIAFRDHSDDLSVSAHYRHSGNLSIRQ